jgi:Uma2 family endonuclease
VGTHEMTDPVRVERNDRFTYRDYSTWLDNERWELIDGVVHSMSPSPTWRHQTLILKLAGIISAALKSTSCRLAIAPFDVLLPDSISANEEDIETVVQPDLLVVRDPAKVREHGCVGAPDWVIEILSPSSAHRDMGEKLRLYERHGVGEYWIVDPAGNTVTVHLLEAGTYGQPRIYGQNERIKIGTLAGLIVSLEDIFREN